MIQGEVMYYTLELLHLSMNTPPKPFIWTARAGDILAKVTRAKAALTRVGR
jgi:hypothetical protein